MLARPAHATNEENDGVCTPDKPRVDLMIEGARSSRGHYIIQLYPDDPKRFLAHNGRVDQVRVKVETPMTSACIAAPSAGYYGLVLYHDENDDDEFNRNALGLPNEGFGLSNNAPTFLGLPSFSSVRFKVGDGDNTLHIKVRYRSASNPLAR